MAKTLELVQPKSRKAWREWLKKHHASSSGIWLVIAKKHTGIPSLTYNDAVEEALCFGWIDSLMNPIDEALYKQMFTPRKSKSLWSALNRTRVERLIASGLMTSPGMKMIDVAKESGRWDAHAPSEALTLPPELRKALNANTDAKKNWPTYTESQRKMFLYMVNGAKRPETRAKRVARVVDIVSRKLRFSDLVAAAMKGKKKTS
ncbi:MAG TPA: YdeI/OmpD-associated family protein [Vicinamibacterales bacterium]|nr:YdeI/OmpD-associated family protein [Vicinamibacterales bacterium]